MIVSYFIRFLVVNSIDGLINLFCHDEEGLADGQMCRLNVRHNVVVYILTSAFHIHYAPILRKQDKRFYDVGFFHAQWLGIFLEQTLGVVLDNPMGYPCPIKPPFLFL